MQFHECVEMKSRKKHGNGDPPPLSDLQLVFIGEDQMWKLYLAISTEINNLFKIDSFNFNLKYSSEMVMMWYLSKDYRA